MAESNRGVWLMHGMGPGGEPVVEVIDSRHRQLLVGTIPHDIDGGRFCAELRRFLDAVDPRPSVAIPTRPPLSFRVERRPVPLRLSPRD